MVFVANILYDKADPTTTYGGVVITRQDNGIVTFCSNVGDPELDWLIAEKVIQLYFSQLAATVLAGVTLEQYVSDVPGWQWATSLTHSIKMLVRKRNGNPK